VEGKRVVLAVLAAGVNPGARDIDRKSFVDHATQPRLVELRQLDTGEAVPVASV